MPLLLLREPARTVVGPSVPKGLWRFVITDAAGVSVGEPRATGRTVTWQLSGTSSASFSIRDTDPMWTQIATGSSNLKVFNSRGDLVFYGPIVSDQESASGQGATVQFTAADQSWILGKRFAAKDPSGVGETFTSTDPATIIAALVGEVNGEKPTGISAVVTSDTFPPTTVTYVWKKVLDALNELGSTEGSYEWTLSYIDGANGAAPVVALNLQAQAGTDIRNQTFFEYGSGTRHNCSSYTVTHNETNRATLVWALGNGGFTSASAEAAGDQEVFQRYEDVVSFNDITDVSLLSTLALAHVAVRKVPQTLVNVTPFPATAPRYGVDWNLGDLVSIRIMSRGSVRAEGVGRIWGATVGLTDAGDEQATITLQPGSN